jgi:hypothetical protein
LSLVDVDFGGESNSAQLVAGSNHSISDVITCFMFLFS